MEIAELLVQTVKAAGCSQATLKACRVAGVRLVELGSLNLALCYTLEYGLHDQVKVEWTGPTKGDDPAFRSFLRASNAESFPPVAKPLADALTERVRAQASRASALLKLVK